MIILILIRFQVKKLQNNLHQNNLHRHKQLEERPGMYTTMKGTILITYRDLGLNTLSKVGDLFCRARQSVSLEYQLNDEWRFRQHV
jgi:hypothetical protein